MENHGFRPSGALVRGLGGKVGRLPNDRTRLRLAKETLMGLFCKCQHRCLGRDYGWSYRAMGSNPFLQGECQFQPGLKVGKTEGVSETPTLQVD